MDTLQISFPTADTTTMQFKEMNGIQLPSPYPTGTDIAANYPQMFWIEQDINGADNICTSMTLGQGKFTLVDTSNVVHVGQSFDVVPVCKTDGDRIAYPHGIRTRPRPNIV